MILEDPGYRPSLRRPAPEVVACRFCGVPLKQPRQGGRPPSRCKACGGSGTPIAPFAGRVKRGRWRWRIAQLERRRHPDAITVTYVRCPGPLCNCLSCRRDRGARDLT